MPVDPDKPAVKPAEGARSLVVDRKLLFRLFFFVAFAYLLYQLVLIFAPFVATLMAAATLVFVFQPVHRRILHWSGQRPSLAAAVGTAALLLLIIIPAVAMVWLVSRQVAQAIPTVQAWLETYEAGGSSALMAALPGPLVELFNRADAFVDSWGVDLGALAKSGLERLGAAMAGFGAGFVRNILSVVMNVAILAIGIFFFLRDGARWTRVVIDVVPLEPQHKDLLVKRLDETLSAVVRGQLVTAAAQGLLATIGFAIAGLPNPVMLGFATTFLSVIPFVGAAGIWVPSALYLFYVGPTWAGVFMVLWGILVVSLVDNFLKPVLIGDKARIPTFLLFFGILGGLQLYGFLGIILGPLLIGVLLTFVAIYREELTEKA